MNAFFQAGFSQAAQVKDFLGSLHIQQIGGVGSSTTCVEVSSAQDTLIIDGGSGIYRASEEHLKGPLGKGKGHAHLFLTHFHWDHLIGLPFYAPHFITGNKITYYAVQPDLAKNVRAVFQKPFFPVPFEALGAQIQFRVLKPRQGIEIGGMLITPYELDHPDPCWGYKIQCGGKTYSHCVDTEGTRVSPEQLGPDLPLYQGVDLMYYDAQYTLPELADKANWGHSAAQIGLDIAFREKVKHILFAHHDPGADIAQLEELKRQTQEYYDWKINTAATNRLELPPVKWAYAHEGLELQL